MKFPNRFYLENCKLQALLLYKLILFVFTIYIWYTFEHIFSILHSRLQDRKEILTYRRFEPYCFILDGQALKLVWLCTILTITHYLSRHLYK